MRKIFCMFGLFVLGLCFVGLNGQVVNASELETDTCVSGSYFNDPTTKELWDKFDMYVSIDNDGYKYFAYEAAVNNNETELLLSVGEEFNKLAAFLRTEGTTATVNRIKRDIGRYGHYCGPGNSGGTPVDDLDAACQLHDSCYKWGGDNTQCNRLFCQKLLRIIQITSPLDLPKYAVAVGASKLFC